MQRSSTRGSHRVCPYFHGVGWLLDNPVRWWFLRPEREIRPLVREGMTVVDLGCGPGMLTLAMASWVGEEGQVIAVDLQQEMLDLVKKKAERKEVSSRIRLHRNTTDSIGLSVKADFILSLYMVHEVADPVHFLREVHDLLSPEGRYLVKEPMFIGRGAFAETGEQARMAGLRPLQWVNQRFRHEALFGL